MGNIFSSEQETIEIVENEKSCSEILSKITDGSVISLDCEGVRISRNGTISLVQIAVKSGAIYLLDVQQCPLIVTKGGLKNLLESEKVTKIVHDCRNDSACLRHQFKVELTNVFDTQTAYQILLEQDKKEPEQDIGLNKLCEKYGFPQNTTNIRGYYGEDEVGKRPLTDKMIEYAAADVRPLYKLYEEMDAKIKSNFRDVFRERCVRRLTMNC